MIATELEIGQKRAEQLAERMREYKPSAELPDEVRDGVRAAGTMAHFALIAWEALQQFLREGAEGGLARKITAKTVLTLTTWKKNVGMAIRPVEQWQEKVSFAFSLEQLRTLEHRLAEAQAQAEQLLQFISSPPPTLSSEILEKLESIGRNYDDNEYLDADTFLSQMREHAGS
jgi:hypothetical protein